jgi:hypothetical protein
MPLILVYHQHESYFQSQRELNTHAANRCQGPGCSKPTERHLNSMQRAAAFARVAEKRYITQSCFWGQPYLDKMTSNKKRDLPAFWSLRTHGQPFNDERLTDGASNHFKIVDPPKLGSPPPRPVGPATESLATLKSSLQNGFALFQDNKDMTPLHMQPGTLKKLREYAFKLRMCAVIWYS